MAKRETYNKGSCEVLEPDDLTALTQLAVSCLKRHGGQIAKYENSQAGLEQFVQKSAEFFEYCNEVNSTLEPQQRLIPDVESWCCFMGVTRVTIHQYAKRNQQWSDAIAMIKEALLMGKKQLAMHNRIPSLIFLFDATNNHNYVSTSEFHLVADAPQDTASPRIATEELARIAETATEPPQLPIDIPE